MTEQNRPMHFGRAIHMDLARASDADLERAFQTLDGFDNAGKASAYTQMLIDDRIDDINAETDRRAGAPVATVVRLPRSHYFPTAGEHELASFDGLVPGETSAL